MAQSLTKDMEKNIIEMKAFYCLQSSLIRNNIFMLQSTYFNIGQFSMIIMENSSSITSSIIEFWVFLLLQSTQNQFISFSYLDFRPHFSGSFILGAVCWPIKSEHNSYEIQFLSPLISSLWRTIPWAPIPKIPFL